MVEDERTRIDKDGKVWKLDPFDGKWYRLILSYKRDEQGNMTDFWSDDPRATRQVLAAEV